MAENITVINETTVSETNVKCPGCGGTLKYDPSALKLVCVSCGLTKDLTAPEAGAVIEELDFNTAVQRASVNWGTVRKLITCANCGGQSVYEASQVSGCCPFCGSTNVMPAAENEQIMAPGAVIPFAIDKAKAEKCFHDHLKKKRYIYQSALNSKLENVIGVYLPFWTFDTDTVSSYSAKIGFERTTNDGTVVDWKTYRGVRNQFIDDMIVFASANLRNDHIPKVANFYFDKLVPYDPKYLAGIVAERYTVGLNEGWEKAKVQIAKKLRTDIGTAEMNKHGGDTVGRVQLSTNYYNVKFKYILAPIYLATYKYANKTYQVAVNGQSGAVDCDAPSWRWLLILMCILAALTIMTLMFLFRFFN